jgi:hypothetical protein
MSAMCASVAFRTSFFIKKKKNKVQNSIIDALILNLIDIVVCVVFALHSRKVKTEWIFDYYT